MPLVRSTVEIPGTDIETVWDTVSSFESYPETMPDVISVKFLERTPTTAVTSWNIMLNGSELAWTERETFEPHHRIVFESIEGDLEVFRGEWLLEETDDARIRVTLEVEFDLGIPSLSEVLDPIGSQAIESNSVSMLTALKNKIS